MVIATQSIQTQNVSVPCSNSNRKMRVLQNSMLTTAAIPLGKQPFPRYCRNHCPHYRGITAAVVSITVVNPWLLRYYRHPHYRTGLKYKIQQDQTRIATTSHCTAMCQCIIKQAGGGVSKLNVQSVCWQDFIACSINTRPLSHFWHVFSDRQTDRQTDPQQYHVNSRSDCAQQFNRLKTAWKQIIMPLAIRDDKTRLKTSGRISKARYRILQ